MRFRIIPALLLVSAASLATAQSMNVDTEKSKLTIEVSKSGLFSKFAHDHQIAAPPSAGSIDPTARKVNLRFETSKMKVLDPEVSDSDRAEIQSTMLSEKVLDPQRFPEITFASTRVLQDGGSGFTVEGELTLHGATRPVTVPVSLTKGHYVGTVKIKQSDFGMKPVKVLGGTVKVKDVVQITFDIVPRP